MVIGIVAVVLALMMFNRQQPVKQSKVVVAAKGIEAQTTLGAEHLKLADWPHDNLPVGAQNNIAALTNRQTISNIAAGEIILQGQLAGPETKAGLSYAITPGYRAISLAVNETSNVSGFVLPGNYVDVLLNSKNLEDVSLSKIILEHVRVLAIAQERAVKDASKPRVVNVVTLELTPQEAELLDMSRSIGSVSLVLRANNDVNKANTRGVRQQDLNEQQPTIEIIRGSKRTMEKGVSN